MIPSSPTTRAPLLAADRIVARYPRFTLGPLSCVVHSGERVALIGRNGAGKSTMLALLAGQRHATHGTVALTAPPEPSEEPRDMRLRLRRDVAYVGATLQALPWYTVRRHFAFLSQVHPRWNTARATELARTLRLDLDATTGTLSRGNLVKVNLCTAWGQEARVLLLDEPTAGLDPVARADMLCELERFIEAHPAAAVVYATHLLDELHTIEPDRVLVLRDGMLQQFASRETHQFDPQVLTGLMTGVRLVSTVEGAA